MTPSHVQSILKKCEDGVATAAEEAELARLLQDQELQGGPWSMLAEAVRGEVGPEEELARGLPVLDPRWDLALDVAREEICRVASRQDIAPAVMAALEAGGEAAGALMSIGEAISAEAGAPDLADGIMAALEQDDAWQRDLSAMADGVLRPEARRAVVARLAEEPAGRQVVLAHLELGRQIRAALASELALAPEEDLWPAVAEELGLAYADSLAALREEIALQEVDLVEGVMFRIAPRSAPRASEQADLDEAPPVIEEVAPRPASAPARGRSRSPYPLAAVLLAGAMALLVTGLLSPTSEDLTEVAASDDAGDVRPALELARVNDTEIEELVVEQDALVQVFQLDGAPMVIWIEEGAHVGESDGVTL